MGSMIDANDFMNLNSMSIDELLEFTKDCGLIIEDGVITGYEQKGD